MKQYKLTSLNTEQVFSEVKKRLKPNEKYILSIKKDVKRSIKANAQVHVWIPKIAAYTGNDIKTTELICKLDHGLPILLNDDNHGARTEWVLNELNFFSRSYNNQVKIMAGFAVTSLFNTEQHNQYRDSIQQFWLEHGLELNYLK